MTKGEQVYTIHELAEETNMFPVEAEDAIRELHSEGKVRAFWYKGDIYVKVKDNDPNVLLSKVNAISECDCENCRRNREQAQEEEQGQVGKEDSRVGEDGMYA